MAVINNTLSEIGDVVVFKTTPVSGITQINSFTDGIVGETVDRFFEKEFRYTLDGINWSDYKALIQSNLQSIEVDSTYDVQLEYKYTRQGISTVGILQFDWINIEVQSVDKECGEAFESSVFSYFFDTCCESEISDWCSNVLRKIYEPGIVSQTLTRGQNQNENQEDRDYIDLWRTITCFFGLHVGYARKFESFDQDRRLLERYLLTKGLYVNKDTSIEQMVHLMRTFYNQISKRGTLGISLSETVDVDGQQINIDGELLRLIRFNKVCDEFIFAMNSPSTIGWVMNTNSPLNKYIHDNPWLIKLFNQIEDINDVPLIQPSSVSLLTEDGFNNVFRINNVLDGQSAGIALESFNEEFVTKIDPSISYELTFWVKGDGLLTASVDGFDSLNSNQNPSLTIPITQDQVSIRSKRLINDKTWFFVRIIVYPSTESIVTNSNLQKPNIGVGWNLKWKPNTCKAGVRILMDRSGVSNNSPTVSNNEIIIDNNELKTLTLTHLISNYNDVEDDPFASIDISAFSGPGDLLLDSNIVNSLPINITKQQIEDGLLQFQDDGSVVGSKIITLDYTVNDEQPIGSDSDILYIRDIVLKPLKTSYGKGIVGSPLMAETWIKNRSELSDDQITQIMRSYLIPHNIGLKNNFLLKKNGSGGTIPTTGGLYEERYEEIYD